jgi:hypothetical protein
LSHMEDVATNWKTALDANNLFFTSATKMDWQIFHDLACIKVYWVFFLKSSKL